MRPFSKLWINSGFRRLERWSANRGDRTGSLRLSEKAATISLRKGDRDGVGRALVAQGSCLYYLDRSEEAIETLKTALDYLAASSTRNRFSALQVSGLAHRGLGDLHAALENVDAAQEALPLDDAWAKGKLLWLRGEIYADLGRLDQATLLLKDVVVKIISAAIADLLQTGRVGLTLTLVKHIVVQIEAERQKR